MKFNCISFDFDGTICDTRNAIKYTLYELFPVKTGEEIDNCIAMGLSLTDTFAELLGDSISESEISTLTSRYRKKYNSEFFIHQTLYPHVKETIKHLYDKNVLVIIVSNKGEQSIYEFLDKYDLSRFISLVVGSRENVKPKPSVEPWNNVIAKKFTSLSLSNVLHVGDTEPDIEYAKNLKIPCAYMTYGFGKPVSELTLKPDYIFERFNDILKII
ncbi:MULTISPECIES: HAD family hydrolase [unclassified Brenneria]|uniref:HAD family hydrolase n=1 Tax=unclassified Brenneria TaxID=2634434 RepID=UPI0015564AC3|nr:MULTISPECIES: HAD family hydrolase [unclassified Brenneria]MBJ7221435.1 HAD family hydrolase [Brenneria sp. L3-3C-1]MEE3642678.1 HAD family hydrolase [Brenneria sp. L3_3C_1]MEE3652590.1 HAD family hydrolase [Brenneria sp. HEZEL_4_2_4]NPD02547.1 HAD family hydrolase [Brenneria sp. hezel4-2-4]